MQLLYKIIVLLGILSGITLMVYGCFLLAKWLGLIVLGAIIYVLFVSISEEV